MAEAEIRVHNRGDLSSAGLPVAYGIKDHEGNVITLNRETLAVRKEANIIREVKIPDNIRPGDYVFYAMLEYKGQNSTGTDTFKIEIKGNKEKKMTLWKFVKEHKTAVGLFVTMGVMLCLIMMGLEIRVERDGRP